MAWPSAGSLTLTNGSANVTGTGTLFLSAYVDDGLQINGVGLFEIAAITDNTHLTLATNYSGTTGTKANGAWSIVPCSPLRGSVQNLAASVSGLIANWSGAFQMSSPSGPVSVLNGQLKFPATQNPSSDPNTLDDYREGTWTPSLSIGGSTVGIVLESSSRGAYTKIGNRVLFNVFILLTSKGGASGDVSVSGPPFTAFDHFPVASRFAGISGTIQSPGAFVLGGTQSITLYSMSSGSPANIQGADLTDTTQLILNGSYRV